MYICAYRYIYIYISIFLLYIYASNGGGRGMRPLALCLHSGSGAPHTKAYLTECIYQLVLESHPPLKLVNLFFTITLPPSQL